jgi:hypothetical protein
MNFYEFLEGFARVAEMLSLITPKYNSFKEVVILKDYSERSTCHLRDKIDG